LALVKGGGIQNLGLGALFVVPNYQASGSQAAGRHGPIGREKHEKEWRQKKNHGTGAVQLGKGDVGISGKTQKNPSGRGKDHGSHHRREI